MPRLLRRALRLPLIGSALVLAACGGSGGTLTKAQYDAKVNRLCLLSADQFRELHMDNSVGDWRHYATNVVHIDWHFDDTLSALKPPASLASEAALYLRGNEKVLRDDESAIAAAKASDRTALHAAITQANKDSVRTYPSAKAIGASDCYFP